MAFPTLPAGCLAGKSGHHRVSSHVRAGQLQFQPASIVSNIPMATTPGLLGNLVPLARFHGSPALSQDPTQQINKNNPMKTVQRLKYNTVLTLQAIESSYPTPQRMYDRQTIHRAT